MIPPPDRYARQSRFLGAEAQAKLAGATVAVVGIGALGGTTAALLARAGVGTIRVIDRDFLEPHNLPLQALFDERSLTQALPKAEAAANRLREINATISIESIVADCSAGNIDKLLGDATCVCDGTDNFATRFLINDWAVKTGTPWVFAGVLGAAGQAMAIVPNRSPCLACLLEGPPPAGQTPTCETAGMLNATVAAVAAIQVAETLKIVAGQTDRLRRGLLAIDLWDNLVRPLHAARWKPNPACRACGERDFTHLRAEADSAVLCGRNSVQLSPVGPPPDWPAITARLQALGDVIANRFMLRFSNATVAFALFPDGRVIVQNTADPRIARAVRDRYIGG